MRSVPLLKELREHQQLSQRDLAQKSGVAHDTIGQLERGERKARTATVKKLAAALNVTPSILTLRFKDLLALTGEELSRIGGPKAVQAVLEYLTSVEFQQNHPNHELLMDRRASVSYRPSSFLPAPDDQESASASYKPSSLPPAPDDQDLSIDKVWNDVLDVVDLVNGKLHPDEVAKHTSQGEFIETAESALLLARLSTHLLRQVTNRLDTRGRHTGDHNVPEGIEKLSRPLVDAWLEGAAVTKRLVDIAEDASSRLGDPSLEIELEEAKEGGNHAEVDQM